MTFELPVVVAIGMGEIAIVVVIIVLLFGAAKIPELARSVGRAKSEFEAGKREGEREAEEEARLAREARDLGLDPAGKRPDELRREIAEARKRAPPGQERR